MSSGQQLMALLRKEWLTDWRQRSTMAGIGVYVVASCFVIFLVFKGSITFPTWLALLWIVQLFTTLQATGRSFQRDANERFYYLRMISKPGLFIIAKTLYNVLILFILALLTFAMLSLFFGSQVDNAGMFVLVFFLGAIGFSNLFTLLSAIAARTNNPVLLAILGFPIVLPLIMLVIKLSTAVDTSLIQNDIYLGLAAVLVLDVIIFILSLVLFPYLWKD
jgi:heme exporter protein B